MKYASKQTLKPLKYVLLEVNFQNYTSTTT